MTTAAEADALWAELDDLLTHLSTERADRARARFAVAPASVAAATRAAAEAGALSPASVAKLTA